MRQQHRVLALTAAVCASAVVATGCATRHEPGNTAAPQLEEPRVVTEPPESEPQPTLPPPVPRPTRPPTQPSDPKPSDIIVGTVTSGGTGPCYGVEDNEGRQYALYGGEGIALARGDTVRVKVKPLLLKIYCGPGDHFAIVTIDRVR